MKRAGLAEAEALQQGFAQAMTAVAKKIPQNVTLDVRRWAVEAVPHFEEVMWRWTEVLSEGDKTWCCIGLARFYKSLSQWDEAERCYRRALAISKAQLGDRHPNTAKSLNNLAGLCRSQGRYGEAEPLYVSALEIRRTELGDRHSSTASSLNNLAGLYYNTGRLPEAAAAMSGVVSIFEELLGPTHPNTITVQRNLEAIQQAIDSSR